MSRLKDAKCAHKDVKCAHNIHSAPCQNTQGAILYQMKQVEIQRCNAMRNKFEK